MPKHAQVLLYIYFVAMITWIGYNMIFNRDEFRCATAYYVAPGNVERVCAKFRD